MVRNMSRPYKGRLWGGAHEAAAGFYGGAAFAAEGALVWFVGRDGQAEEGLGLDGKFNFAAAAIDKRAHGDYTAAGFFDDLNRVESGTAGGPNVFDDEDFFAGFEGEATAQAQTATGVAFDENGGYTGLYAIFGCRQGAGDFLADNDAAEGGGDDGLNSGIGKKRGQGLA